MRECWKTGILLFIRQVIRPEGFFSLPSLINLETSGSDQSSDWEDEKNASAFFEFRLVHQI